MPVINLFNNVSLAQEVHLQTGRHSKGANGVYLQLALDDTDAGRKRVVNQATTQRVAGILLTDCAKSIGRTSEVSDDGLDRKGLRMLLQGKLNLSFGF